MKTSKSIFITALIALLVAALLACLRALHSTAYDILVTALGAYGYICAAVVLFRWVGDGAALPTINLHPRKRVKKGKPKEHIPTVVGEVADALPEDFDTVFDSIQKETEKEAAI